ncbi:hypothetical protein FOPG_01397 [Fusarium oxysporum f. sp. conglutinans race 2 54008]|uniref:Uncharacterized protein n=1 Tax=Fusarium oxysporum f. sp. conglutinans race 2 54008 TaxID=1089457 RepID=X0IV30_FUSOX|nr:hypothetical protein FOPG_01397 [Fusarium oxysporum f. sp. conglutinans race 2 54008]
MAALPWKFRFMPQAQVPASGRPSKGLHPELTSSGR